jgi:hypothetical protein
MSKEMEALNAYIENQQKAINQLTQNIMMLETKNKLLENEVKRVESINSGYKNDAEEAKFKRKSLAEIAKGSGSDRKDEPPKPESHGQQKITMQGFSLKTQQELLIKR